MIPAARQPLAWWQHALAIAALSLTILLRFYPAVTSTAPLGDEMAQEKAFLEAVSYTHLRAHETVLDLVCRLLLEKKKY